MLLPAIFKDNSLCSQYKESYEEVYKEFLWVIFVCLFNVANLVYLYFDIIYYWFMKFRIKQSFFLIDHKISEKLRQNKSERECKNTELQSKYLWSGSWASKKYIIAEVY